MSELNISDNILRLRHQKKITQEELAQLIGVTKASVSKWETKQSLPDIVLLPQLASFFDVTVDELLGYNPQLSKEQIQKYYIDFTSEFAQKPFEEVMSQVKSLVKQYYSCYPFLLQICVLWLNHFILAPQSQQTDILDDTASLCSHIMDNCQDAGICHDAMIIKTMIDLQCGRTDKVIDTLEDILNPYHFHQNESLLIQAYQVQGEIEKAHQFTQLSIYTHLMEFVNLSIQYLTLHANDFTLCEETMHRIDQIIEVYHLDRLNPNTIAQYQYQAAYIYCLQNNQSSATDRLNQYVQSACQLFYEDHILLHGDDYFDAIHYYFENSDLGVNPVRDKKLVFNNAMAALDHPIFKDCIDKQDIEFMKEKLDREGNDNESS